MGEANRRKKLDPKFGSRENKAQRWIKQMEEALPSHCRPDGGHWAFATVKEGGDCYFTVYNFQVMPDRYGFMIFFIGSNLAYSVLIKESDLQRIVPKNVFAKIKKALDPYMSIGNFLSHHTGTPRFIRLEDTPISLKCKPCPEERYKANNGEWVLPLVGEPLT